MSSGRFVAEIPIRWSGTEERIAFARVQTAQTLKNEVLSEYLKRERAFRADPDYRRLVAESREAKREGRANGTVRKDAPKSVPSAVTPRTFVFIDPKERNAAWKALYERHGLIGETPVAKLTEAGGEWYENTKTFVRRLTARQRSRGSSGLDAATIHHEIFKRQRDRILEYVNAKPRKTNAGTKLGRPRRASRRHPTTSVTGSSSKTTGGLSVDLQREVFSWKAAKGQPKIEARLRFPKNDPWLRKAVTLPIAQVRVRYRTLRGKLQWYVQLVMIGLPPVRPQLRQEIHLRPRDTVGVDVGSRHIAAVGSESALLADLAPTMIAREAKRDGCVTDERDGDRYKRDRWSRRLQRRISIKKSRHVENLPAVCLREKTLTNTRDGKANGKTVLVPAGFIKYAKVVSSKRARALSAKLADVARADAAARMNDHGRLVNAILAMGDQVILEHLSYVGWQRSFGRQVRRHSPGAFEALLRRRILLSGGSIGDINTVKTFLSQVCQCGERLAVPIRGRIADRMKPTCSVCGRVEVQRDLYSAFLARFASETSVDSQAALAAWAGAFGLLCGARQTYDKAEDRRVLRLSRVIDASASSLCALAPHVQVAGGSPPVATVDPTHSALASVQDEGGRKNGSESFERICGVYAPQAHSHETLRAPLPPSIPVRGIDRVRAEPPLEIPMGNPRDSRDG